MMKAHLSVFALSAIIIASIGMAPAFGQIQNSVVVTTDKTSYLEGETIIVTGEVNALLGGEALSLMVTAPNGNVVSVAQVSPSIEGDFTRIITTGGPLWIQDGFYTVTAQQNQLSEYTSSVQVDIKEGVVVPEFGTIAVMILAVAIISIIAVSAKSRLSIMPRY